MSSWRTALLVVLASTLVVVSATTALERSSSVVPMVEAIPIGPTDPLVARGLIIPVQGITRAGLRDNFHDRRGKRPHNALDIMAKRGTPVVAAGDGRVAKMYRHPLGGLCVYQYDSSGEYVYFYAHLARFAEGLAEGSELKRGDPIGFVGTTGNASPTAPHLHFAVAKLGPERKWYKGTPVNPYPYLLEARR